MEAWQKWLVVVAGIVALLDQWVTGYYLNVIGGVVAAIIALISK